MLDFENLIYINNNLVTIFFSKLYKIKYKNAK